MAISIPTRTVVFDYGEVISVSPTAADQDELVRIAGLDAATSGPDAQTTFWRSYWRYRDGLDQGTISVRDYWTLIAADVGVKWSASRVHRLWVADFRSWLSVDEATVDVIVELKDGGTRLALLSNAGRDFGSYFRHGPLADLFDDFFVSGELGLIKPGADIFEAVLADLGITADEMVFIDNKAVNVEGAQALGIAGHVYTGADELRTYLRSLEVSGSSN